MIKKSINKLLQNVGYEFRKVSSRDPTELKPINSMEMALLRLKERNINPDLIVDIGAAKGNWTELSLEVWPESEYLLIEPISEQIQKIHSSLIARENINIVEGVAGEKEGEVQLSVTDDLDGSGIYGDSSTNLRPVKVFPLDSLLSIKKKQSIVLKLDTHGFEIPIFEGAKETLKNTEAIIVEVYGFYVSPTGKLFHEISSYLAEKGFRLFDIVDIVHRPKDNAFWQADAIYIKQNNPVFDKNTYV
jgi:FkbM family methyltransferase